MVVRECRVEVATTSGTKEIGDIHQIRKKVGRSKEQLKTESGKN